MTFLIEQLPQLLLFVLVVVGALPAIGQGRMLLLGTAGFYATGEFLAAWLPTLGFAPGTLVLALGGLGGGASAALFGLLCRRLRGDYFALGSLSFAELVRQTLLLNPPFFGPQGISGVARGTALGLSLALPWTLVALGGLLVVGAVLTAQALRSPWGAALRACGDHELAAQTAGLPVERIRLVALVYAGTFAGIAGALGARELGLADVENFSLTESVMVLMAVLLTGRPRLKRALGFAIILGLLSELLRFLFGGAWRQMAFGICLGVLALIVRDQLSDGALNGGGP